MRPKRTQSCECEECPEWIFTFADLVMLMMGFFVILWVLKPAAAGANAPPGSAQREEWEQTVAAIRDAFGYVPTIGSNDPIDRILLERKLNFGTWRGPGLGGETNEPRTGAIGSDRHTTMLRPAKQLGMGGTVHFAAGITAVAPQEHSRLDQVADLIRGHRVVVIVKGHAALDDAPGPDSEHALLNLSIQRAAAVRDYLVSRGVSPDTLRIMGCSTYEPVAGRAYTTDSRAFNRRVEIMATDTLAEQFRGGKNPAGSGDDVNPK